MSQYGNIGQLNIEINANSKLAVEGLENLSRALSNLTFGNVSGLKEFTKGLKALSKVSIDGNLTSTLSTLQTQISGLNFEVSGLATFSDAMKKLGSKAVDNAINKIPQLATAMRGLFDKLSGSNVIRQDIIDMTKALADFTSNGAKVESASNKIAKGLNKVGKSAQKNKGLIAQFFAGFSAGNFAGNFTANLIASLIRNIFSSVREAYDNMLTYASDLVETQNVIERTFGESKNVAEDFSKSALKMYGMNELEAKKMIGTFQAMGTALGETKERMADVSTSMGALVGDYASFFNKEVADVANDFTTIFTGHTKAMRTYGIDLTNAMLQNFADKQGWNVQVKSLSQYNKAIIRYNYLVSRSQDILGDFQRTQGSYANQVKLLSQQFKELFGTLGQVGTAILTPIYQLINDIVSKIRQFAEQLVAFLGIDNFISISGGAVEGLENMADGLEDVENSADGSAKALKKLKTYSVGIDELNIIKPNEDKATGGSGLGQDDMQGNWDTDWWDKLTKGKDDLIDFSKLIENIYNTIKPTIDAFKEFYKNVVEPLGKVAFDGLISLYEDFLKPVAKWTLGKAFPYLFNTLADIGKKIQWNVISNGIKNLMQALGKASTGIGKGLLDFFKSIEPVLKPAIATTINLIAKAFELLAKALNKIPVKVFELIGRGLGVILTYKAVNGMITNLGKAFSNLGNSLMAGAWQSNLLNNFPKIRDAIFGAGSALDKFGLAIQGISSTIAIISAIAMAIYQVYDYCKKLEEERYDKILGDVGLSVEELNTKLERTNELANIQAKWESGMADAQVDAMYIKTLADEYFRLADMEGKTAEQEELLKYYAGELIKLCPELEGAIDPLTGAYKENKQAITDIINEQIKMTLVEGMKDYLRDTTKQIVDNTLAMEQLKKKMEEIPKTIEKTQGQRDWKYKITVENPDYVKIEQDLENLKKANDEVIKSYKNVSQKMVDTTMGKDVFGMFVNIDTAKIEENTNTAISTVSNAFKNIPEEEKPNIEVNAKVDEEKTKATISEAKTKIENIPEEEKPQIKITTQLNEESVNKVVEDTKTKVDEATTFFNDNGIKITTSINNDGIIEGFSNTQTIVETKGQELVATASNVGLGMTTALNTTLTNNNPVLTEVITENATVIKTTFEDAKIGLGIKGNTSTVFEEYAKAIVNGFKGGIEKNKGISLNATSVWVKDIMRTFKGNDVEGINYNVWSEYAHQIIQGFADGIHKWSYIAREAIRRWVEEMMSEFEEDMEIESPSKVFKGYGYYTVAGFNQGIKDNQNSSITLVKNWVDDIEKQMSAIENFNVDMSNTIKGLDSLTAKVNTQVDMSGFYGELQKAQELGMNTSLNTYAENRQAIEVNIPNITLEVDSREIAKANYKGQKQLGYQIRR